MTKVYFVRHAKPDLSVHDDMNRPLTKEGHTSSKRVTQILFNKGITQIFSSPYRRAVDTVSDLALHLHLPVICIDDFRERKIANDWIEDFNSFAKAQWADFHYKLPTGESLYDVQKRNIESLRKLLNQYVNEHIVVGTHGTALSTIVNYYMNDHHYAYFERIKHLMPLIVCLTFEGETFKSYEEFTI